MLVIRGIFIGLCMFWVIAGSASAATTKAAAKPSAAGPGDGMIYFMRPMPIMGWANKPDVRLNGRLVGEISPGT
jgi:hypothetical protein